MDLKDNITKVTYYHGMRTIGGTYIEIERNDYKIYFDFGAVFDPNISIEGNMLENYIKNDLIPEIIGVYDRRITGQLNKDYSKKAVFVSHIHLDHTQMINFIDPEIPVYMTNDTKNLLEVLNINGDFISKNPYIDGTRDIVGVNYEDTITIGDISIKFVRVDHDGYGASGFIITTPDVKVVYTGDIRFHGYLENEILNFIEEAKNPDLLIMEGVNVSFDENGKDDEGKYNSELDLLNAFESILVDNSNYPLFFNYYEANIERIIKLIQIAKKNNKEIVLDSYYANVLKKVVDLDVKYYKFNNKVYDLDFQYEVDINLMQNPKYIFQLPIENLDILNQIPKNSIYLHIDAVPLGEFDSNYEPFLNKIKNYFKNYYILKCSGHAHSDDLFRIIDEIKPKILTPIHSFKPEMLYNVYGDTILPERNQIIQWRKNEKI
ncbi:MAG: MBL fold metallo-hydrolase [Helcococcus sp.]|nr:MBL fold metallo-hydrolase [Helcococcus sp.]